MSPIVLATEQYDDWLRQQLDRLQVALDQPALDEKHRQMARDPFRLLRATFYRWVQLWTVAWPHGCAPELQAAPRVLAVGDLHLENFGTWRDAEGRLVWGINDFDEACELPYTNDLVRLATSAWLTIQQDDALLISPEAACNALLVGYRSRLKDTALAQPIVLAEAGEWLWLRGIAEAQLRNPQKFWDKLDEALDCAGPPPHLRPRPKPRAEPRHGAAHTAAVPVGHDTVPASVRHAIQTISLPGFHSLRWKTRQAGLGSLGRPRYVEICQWHGAKVAREAKALVPSAYFCATAPTGQRLPASLLSTILHQAIRCPDPYFQQAGHWIVRRLAPDCIKIEMADLPKLVRDQHGEKVAKRERRAFAARLLYAMGCETANVHLGTPGSRAQVLEHLDRLNHAETGWLPQACQVMGAIIEQDLRDWQEYYAASKSVKRGRHGKRAKR